MTLVAERDSLRRKSAEAENEFTSLQQRLQELEESSTKAREEAKAELESTRGEHEASIDPPRHRAIHLTNISFSS